MSNYSARLCLLKAFDAVRRICKRDLFQQASFAKADTQNPRTGTQQVLHKVGNASYCLYSNIQIARMMLPKSPIFAGLATLECRLLHLGQHSSFLGRLWLRLRTFAMPHSLVWVWPDSFISRIDHEECVCVVCEWRLYVWYVSFICNTRLHLIVTRLIRVSV